MKLFLQKKCKIFERWGLHPSVSGGWGLCPQTPSLWRLGASPPDPHCEFLATPLSGLMFASLALYYSASLQLCPLRTLLLPNANFTTAWHICRCNRGNCIPMKDVNNGFPNCLTGEDEDQLVEKQNCEVRFESIL